MNHLNGYVGHRRQIRELFDSVLKQKDYAIEDGLENDLDADEVAEDKALMDRIFTTSCDFYFSRVQPIMDIREDHTASIDCIADTDNPETPTLMDRYILVDQIYTMSGLLRLDILKACRVLPNNYNDFELTVTYFASFKEVCEYFLEEEEKDNFQLLEQVGAELNIDIMNERFTELRQILDESFDIEPVTTIIDGEEVVI
jgi:hypothetical protein